jgi:hypothetical protein
MKPFQTAARICSMNTIRCLAALSVVAALTGCGSSRNIVITDGRPEARESAEATQKIADEYRKAGAHEAAKQVQKQVNARRAEADRKFDSFWDWLVATLLNSWLYSN